MRKLLSALIILSLMLTVQASLAEDIIVLSSPDTQESKAVGSLDDMTLNAEVDLGDRIYTLYKANVTKNIAYSNDYSNFYRNLIKHKIFQFGWCSFLAVLRHPAFAKRLIGAFKKGESVERTEKYVELASICVDPKESGRGIGSELLHYLQSRVDYSTYAYINLETDAENNERANRFYINNGFTLYREYTTAEGRKMNEYHFRPGVI